MRKDYINRVKRFHPEFVKDVIETTLRIHAKDGKAYPLRIAKSVAKRWKNVFRYKITLTLNYLEYMGILGKRLESLEEYKERMQKFKGLYERGKRRVYFYPHSDTLAPVNPGHVLQYRKLSYDELGVKHERIEDYPV